MKIPACLTRLAEQPRWVVWRWQDRPARDGAMKRTKPPFQAHGGRVGGYADNSRPETWTTLTDAEFAFGGGGADGIGLQLMGLSGFAAIDLDNVRGADGQYLPWAAQAIAEANSYAEHTPSGNGGRILGRVPRDRATIHTKRRHPDGGEFEVYANIGEGQGRYITITGDQIDGTPDTLTDISALIDRLMADSAPEKADKGPSMFSAIDPQEKTAAPLAANSGPLRIDTGRDLPEWVLTGISHGLSGDRSADFQSVVNALRPRGVTFEEALQMFRDNPQGPAGKFDGRLEIELRRSWEKAKALEAGGEIPYAPPIEDCDPVDLWGTFDPPELPEGLLPQILDDFARINAAQMDADAAGLAMAALVTCAAAIPDAVQLKVKRHDDWRESARLWAALVGPPSTKKSPIISTATAPLCRLDTELMRAWQTRVRAYDAKTPEERKGQPRPPQTRLRIEDATAEAAQDVLAGSPWGVLLLQDELSGFFGAMDKYNGGKGASAHRAFWLRSFNGGEFALNRVGRGAAIIENLSVSMLGGIQPEPLRKISGDAVDDGLLQRLFPIMLRPATMGRDEPMPPVNAVYGLLIRHLRALTAPVVLEFDDDAQSIRRDLEARHLELQSLEAVNRKLASHVGKYDGLFARLCVVWHCVEHIERTTICEAPAFDGAGLPSTVTGDTARRVAAFLHRFLMRHAMAFYSGVLGLSDDHDRLTAIAGHILAHRLDRLTNRDVQRGDRAMRGLREHEIRPLLEQLAALGWLTQIPGPRPTLPPHWVVNPQVHARFADRGRREAERRAAARAALAANAGARA